ncbi:MAG TPA: AIR carboxylase family protein, partial [Candidatus Peregrinibacteria bacterium]|nr:AIR carboxylase family protein [Candidatus Peregrinibacteria bacterium]
MLVVFLLGSEVDRPHQEKIAQVLDNFQVSYEVYVASAHKVPEKTLEIIKKYNQEKEICYITIAGRSNALSGLVAANSIHPVIACPPFKDKDDMMININSTLQMPSETPVLTVLDPENAALAA